MSAVVVRQKVLVLWTEAPEPYGRVCAWSVWDGSGQSAHQAGDGDQPPYPTVIEAMKDGWRIIQWPQSIAAAPGAEHRTGLLRFEFVLERLVEKHV